MTKKTSPLAEAAQAFDDELARYAQLGETFVRTPLTTTKQLERANAVIDDLAAQETRLAEAGQRLVAAIAEARARQEALAQQVVDRLPELRARNASLRELLAELASIGAETGVLNERALAIAPGELASRPDARKLVDGMQALSDRAAALAARARDAQLDELAAQAHALHQRLGAAAAKLDKAVPKPS